MNPRTTRYHSRSGVPLIPEAHRGVDLATSLVPRPRIKLSLDDTDFARGGEASLVSAEQSERLTRAALAAVLLEPRRGAGGRP
jgi:hypothetical protein